MEVPPEVQARWAEHIEWIRNHLATVKSQFADDPEMLELLGIVDKILDNEFGFTWNKRDNIVVIENVLELALEPDSIPLREPLRNAIIETYPSIVFRLFIERVRRFLNQDGLYIATKDFETLRSTLNNIELISVQRMPYTVEIVGKGRKLLFRLPLEIEVDNPGDMGMPATLADAAIMISLNLDKVFEKIKEMTRELH